MPQKKEKEAARKEPVRHRTKAVTVIKRSATTGRAVWLYQGSSKEGARKAYERVRRKENTRVRWWKSRIKQRAKAILTFLEKLLEAMPMMGGIPPEKRQAIRDLQRLADNPPPCDTGLYNQLQLERRRRKKKKEELQRRREQQQETVTNGTDLKTGRKTASKNPQKLLSKN